MTRRRSLRVRITAAFTIFFALGAALLLSTAYVIVADSTGKPVQAQTLSVLAAQPPGGGPVVVTGVSATTLTNAAGVSVASPGTSGRATSAAPTAAVPLGAVQAAQVDQSRSDLRQVLWWFIGAFVAVVALSAAAGWQVAARALAPLRQITATARDVSGSRLDARIALTGPHDELRELSDTFDAMLGRLERAFLAQRRFVASASHELRTPLTLARIEAELALTETDATPAQLRDALGQIHTTIERGGDLVESLLALAQADETLPGLEPVVLADVVAMAAGLARPRADAAGVTLSVAVGDPATPGPAVAGRLPLIRALVDNLIANAISYNQHGGWVGLELAESGGDACLTIANTGPIVDPRSVEDLFEPFVRADPSRSRRSGGAGLGLAIVRAVAAAHGGRVDAAARPEGGLRIRILLPALAPGDATAVPGTPVAGSTGGCDDRCRTPLETGEPDR